MKKEQKLTGNTLEQQTMEELILYKAMTVKSLLSEEKKTLNISNAQWPTLEISMKFLHFLNQFENSPIKDWLFSFHMVSGLHNVLSFAWCVVLYLLYYSTYSVIVALC